MMCKYIFLCALLFISACKQEPAVVVSKVQDDASMKTADEASLIAVAKEAGISEQDALREKAKFDAIYDKTSAEMKTREQERNERDAAFKKDTCVVDCED
jgi:shikimate 5-dehydrogenase